VLLITVAQLPSVLDLVSAFPAVTFVLDHCGFADLGGDASFDRTLERAIVQLLNTPIPEDPILVQTKGIGYGFVDPKLEALTNGQKHLLRTGPQNARAIKESLRRIALALGIPEERLPNH